MLMVKTKVKYSPIEGLGCFADEFIPKGTITWKFNPNFDMMLTQEEIDILPEATREQVIKYTWFEPKYQKFILPSNDSRFYNHSRNPNTGQDPDNPDVDIDVAYHDIQPGEELLNDYRTMNCDLSEEPYL